MNKFVEQDYQELDKVIYVDNPLEPEKGGYFKAFMERRDFNANRVYMSYDEESGRFNAPFFDDGCKSVPKLDLATGTQIEISRFEIAHHDLSGDCRDFRVISNNVVEQLELAINARQYKQNEFNSLDLFTEHNSNLITLLDTAAKANNPKLPVFDDAQYEPQFNKLEQYLKHFDISFTKDSVVEAARAGSIQNNWGEYQYKCNISETGIKPLIFQADCPESLGSIDLENPNLHKWQTSLPLPREFRSENTYLKAGAEIVGSYVFKNFSAINKGSFSENLKPLIELNDRDNQLLGKSETNRLFVLDMTSIMFSAQLGVSVTQNDINRFNSYDIPTSEMKDLFDLSSRASNYLKSIDLTKNLGSQEQEDSSLSLWQQWKADRTSQAIQMATPSLPEIAKSVGKELIHRDDIIDAISQTINNKVKDISATKEQNRSQTFDKER